MSLEAATSHLPTVARRSSRAKWYPWQTRPRRPHRPDQQTLRSRAHLQLLVIGAALGVPIATVAYFFLVIVSEAQTWTFDHPQTLGFNVTPTWWPLIPMPGLLAAGVGALIFVGLDQGSGKGTFSLAIPGVAPYGSPTHSGSSATPW